MPENARATVRLTLDPAKPMPLTEEQRQELAALATKPDAEIDTSDSGELPASAWKDPKALTPPPKQHISLRLDADVIEFFRATGPRYQSRINAVLRAYAERHAKHGQD